MICNLHSSLPIPRKKLNQPFLSRLMLMRGVTVAANVVMRTIDLPVKWFFNRLRVHLLVVPHNKTDLVEVFDVCSEYFSFLAL